MIGIFKVESTNHFTEFIRVFHTAVMSSHKSLKYQGFVQSKIGHVDMYDTQPFTQKNHLSSIITPIITL